MVYLACFKFDLHTLCLPGFFPPAWATPLTNSQLLWSSQRPRAELYMEHSGCLRLGTSSTDSSPPRLACASLNISVQGSFPSCHSQDSPFPPYPVLTQGHSHHLLSCHHSRRSQQLPNGVLTSALRAVHTSGQGCFSLEEEVCYHMSHNRSLCSRFQSLPCKDARGKRQF